MANQINIQDELRSLNSGLPVDNSPNPFSVPEGYFNGLATSILAKIKTQTTSSTAAELAEIAPLLSGISKEMPYTVPTGFFEQNLLALPGLIDDKEPAILAAISKETPYSVPADYFHNLPEQLVAKITRPEARVVPLFARKWMRVAVAAVFGGVMLIAGYQLLNNKTEDIAEGPSATDTLQTQVARNNESTVIDLASVMQEVNKISTEELTEFIKNAPINTSKLHATATPPEKKAEVEQLLKDVSVPEINAFLNQLPTGDEDLMIID